MNSLEIDGNLLLYGYLVALCSRMTFSCSNTLQGNLAQNFYGYNPYHRDLTPEEKLEAMAKNQEKQSQPSREQGKSQRRQ